MNKRKSKHSQRTHEHFYIYTHLDICTKSTQLKIAQARMRNFDFFPIHKSLRFGIESLFPPNPTINKVKFRPRARFFFSEFDFVHKQNNKKNT